MTPAGRPARTPAGTDGDRAPRPARRALPRALTARTRRALSLRARLLAGLIAVTAVFLVAMGIVSSMVLNRLEQDQFTTGLQLTAKEAPWQISEVTSEYAAAYLSVETGYVGQLTPASPEGDELRAMLAGLAATPASRESAWHQAFASRNTPFSLALRGGPTLRAVWHPLPGDVPTHGKLPPGDNLIVVARAASAVGSQVRGLVLAELITGAVLVGLLVVCGTWLIDRGLAPLGRMARTADLITARGDLTERMPVSSDRHETARLAAAINTMLDRIQQAFSARLRSEHKVRQFAADASHEMRTPLTTIRGYAELYRQGALGPGDLPNAMRRIEQEAERMSRLVAELLELARLDRSSSLDLTETDLTALARDAVADALAVEPERPVTAEAPPSLVVTADEPRIRQVLANLLGNIRAHTPPGTPATIRVSDSGGGALLEVADTGPGMTERDAALAFDRFHRGIRPDGPHGDSANGDSVGSGLGLSIVQAIAAAHGGYARLRSAPGAGTTVQLWIPVKSQIQDSERSLAWPTGLNGSALAEGGTAGDAPDGFGTSPAERISEDALARKATD